MIDNPQEGKMKHIRKKGELPVFPSWIDMLCKRVKNVIFPEKPKDHKVHTRINDGKVACKCRKCGQRRPKSEMVQPLPDNTKYLLTPECAANRAAKIKRREEKKK